MTKKSNVPAVSYEDITLSTGKGFLNANQLQLICKPTPPKYIKTRKAKGGGEWSYVAGSHVKKVLNSAFGWDWDFEVVENKFDISVGQCFVLGKLRVRNEGREIVKMQFGGCDIKFKTEWIDGKKCSTAQPLDLANDMKAAATDSLKKCAAELGFFADVYAPEEFNHITIIDTDDLGPVDVPDSVFEELSALQTESAVLEFANSKACAAYESNPEFVGAVNDRINEIKRDGK